jgi:hypothetical protein
MERTVANWHQISTSVIAIVMNVSGEFARRLQPPAALVLDNCRYLLARGHLHRRMFS